MKAIKSLRFAFILFFSIIFKMQDTFGKTKCHSISIELVRVTHRFISVDLSSEDLESSLKFGFSFKENLTVLFTKMAAQNFL